VEVVYGAIGRFERSKKERKAEKIVRMKQESEVTAHFVKVDPCFWSKSRG
jgi:hypothetical protein